MGRGKKYIDTKDIGTSERWRQSATLTKNCWEAWNLIFGAQLKEPNPKAQIPIHFSLPNLHPIQKIQAHYKGDSLGRAEKNRTRAQSQMAKKGRF